jgi:hypothetical protein
VVRPLGYFWFLYKNLFWTILSFPNPYSQQYSRLPNVISVALTRYSASVVSHVLQTTGGLVLPSDVSIMCLFIYRKLLLNTDFYIPQDSVWKRFQH